VKALIAIVALAMPQTAPAAPVALLAHPVARGDVLAREDFVAGDLPDAEARGALSARGAAGMEARRDLSEGAPVRSGDVMPAQIVRRGEAVTIRYIAGTLTIAASGRALSSGAMGDAVRVVTAGTSRTLDATVDGAGSVRITAP